MNNGTNDVKLATSTRRIAQQQHQHHGLRTLTRWLLAAEWRSHKGRALIAIATIALGVALGYAVQLINSAAFNEFSAAARSLSGQADLEGTSVPARLQLAVAKTKK